jgi:hypothetical protein
MPANARTLFRPVLLLAAGLLQAVAALADPANLTVASSSSPGATTQLILAKRTYQAAMRNGDAVLLLASIRLARTITLRPPIGWILTTTGEAAPDAPVGRSAPADPSAPGTTAILQALAGEDPSLQDLVYDLDAQLPQGRQVTATRASSDLGPGQIDTWRIALSGQTPAELGLIGDGDSVLDLAVTDDNGAIVCALPPGTEAALCRFTPARNGFFNLVVRNRGAVRNSYHLIAS